MKTNETLDMSTSDELLTSGALAAVWESYPCGIVAIGGDGNVRAINPAFETCTGLVGTALLGISEADFDALLGTLQLERRRVETTRGGLRAVHYLRSVTRRSADDLGVSGLSEALREPLASIYGFAELLLTQDYDEETRSSLLATVLEQAEAMSNIINDRLDTQRHPPALVASPLSTLLPRRALVGYQ
jgi:signal transduction histidine kinase